MTRQQRRRAEREAQKVSMNGSLQNQLNEMTDNQVSMTIERLQNESIPFQVNGTVVSVPESFHERFLEITKEVLTELTGYPISLQAVKNMYR